MIELVSVGGGGVPADAFAPSISADGDKVVFYSDASNLAPDFPSRGDVFVHDRSAGTTVAVSRAFNPGGTTDVGSGAISGDGSTIWFTGSAAIGTLFGAAHVVYDLSPSLGDGEFVAYTSDSDAIVPGDADGTTDVLVRAVHVPRVLSATPSVVARGTSATLTVVGDAFGPDTIVRVSPAEGVNVDSVVFTSSTQLQASVTVASSAATGPRRLNVLEPGPGPGINNRAGSSDHCQCLTVS